MWVLGGFWVIEFSPHEWSYFPDSLCAWWSQDTRHCEFSLVRCWIFCVNINSKCSWASLWGKVKSHENNLSFSGLAFGIFEIRVLISIGLIFPHHWEKSHLNNLLIPHELVCFLVWLVGTGIFLALWVSRRFSLQFFQVVLCPVVGSFFTSMDPPGGLSADLWNSFSNSLSYESQPPWSPQTHRSVSSIQGVFQLKLGFLSFFF